jgi:uncharacterized protein YegL
MIMSRRLPVYLLLDTSGSMAGEAIQAVQQGVLMLTEALKTDPRAMETAWLSVITFDSTARVVSPLTDINLFNAPIFSAGGMTSLGAGINQLLQQIDKEVLKATDTQKADYKPMIFMMTDGQPTDAYEQFAHQLKSRKYNVIACAAGENAEVEPLKKITEMVIKLKDCNAKSLQAFFKWMTVSIPTAMTSITVNQMPGGPIVLAPVDSDGEFDFEP